MNKNVISEKTSVTVGVLIALAGGIVWLTEVHTLAQSNSKEIEKYGEIVRNIDQRLARIEGGVNELKRNNEGYRHGKNN